MQTPFHYHSPALKDRQHGATLAIVLIFLVLVTLIGVTALTTTTLEEKMAGNLKEQNLAFQAAEAALRDAKLDISGTDITGATSATARNPLISGATGFGDSAKNRPSCSATTGATLGLCLTTSDAPDAPALNQTSVITRSFTAAPSVQYGTYTGAATLQNVAMQPRYLIEAVRVYPAGEDIAKQVYWYRITARGYGARIETQVTLQEIYRPE